MVGTPVLYLNIRRMYLNLKKKFLVKYIHCRILVENLSKVKEVPLYF